MKNGNSFPNLNHCLELDFRQQLDLQRRLFGSKKRLFFLPPPPPTSLIHEFYVLTSDFTRIILKIKYVFHGLISLHVNFHDNRTKWTLTSNIKNCRWVEKEKEPLTSPMTNFESKLHKMFINGHRWLRERLKIMA